MNTQQRGMTLVEILVGLAIGLVVAAIALTSLQVSQFISTTINEATMLQQDAGTAMRIIGLQIRQAGSTALNLESSFGDATETAALHPVLFEPVLVNGEHLPSDSNRVVAIAAPSVAKSTGPSLQTRYENFAEWLFQGTAATQWDSLLRDCLAQSKSNRSLSPIISSTFFLRDGQLMCTGVAGTPQPVISNVKDFTVRLLTQMSAHTSELEASYRYAVPSEMGDASLPWDRVRAVEICLELESPNIKVPDVGATYLKCNGQQQAKRDRLVVVAKQLFHIRAAVD
ncbi:hypothetical protein SDC9_98281 [bioreactor metagenome]|uniref:Uncharacterized protein n=1 Tax=bioreactor metagenome TaxID=1076179 RepID=A0A645AEA3_9ZZZZ